MKQPVLTVSVAPFWHSGAGIARNSIFTMAALIPAVVLGIMHYRSGAVAVLGLSIATCMLAEALMQKIMGRPITLHDGTAALTGLLLALLLPAGVPWWLVVVGGACAIILGKQIFGGLGGNPVNATLVGWVIIRISWTLRIDADATLVHLSNLSGLSPLAALRGGYGEMLKLSDLFLGNVIGPIGSASLVVFIAGVILAGLGQIKWKVAVSFLVGAAIGALLFGSKILPEGASQGLSAWNLLMIMMFSGPVMLGAFFLATDPPSSPSQPVAMIIFGLGAGLLGMFIQVKGYYYDAGIIFGIMLMNLVSPLLDKIRPKVRGKE